MHVDLRKSGEIVILDLEGRLVAGVGDELFRDSLQEIFSSGWKRVLLNLSRVTYIDSSGVGELAAGIRTARELGVALKATRLSDRVQHVLTLSQILPLLEIHPNEETALASF